MIWAKPDKEEDMTDLQKIRIFKSASKKIMAAAEQLRVAGLDTLNIPGHSDILSALCSVDECINHEVDSLLTYTYEDELL